MFYRKNVGSKESIARIALGLAVAAVALWVWGAAPRGLGVAGAGMFMALTGLFGYCPACALLGRKPQAPQP